MNHEVQSTAAIAESGETSVERRATSDERRGTRAQEGFRIVPTGDGFWDILGPDGRAWIRSQRREGRLTERLNAAYLLGVVDGQAYARHEEKEKNADRH